MPRAGDTMRLIQYLDGQGRQRVAVSGGRAEPVRSIEGFDSSYALALAAVQARTTLQAFVEGLPLRTAGETCGELLAQGRVLPPLTHPDPARCRVTGTG